MSLNLIMNSSQKINEIEFFDYVDFLDNYKSTFYSMCDSQSSVENLHKNFFFDSSEFIETDKKLGSRQTLIVQSLTNLNEYVAKIRTNGLDTGNDQQQFVEKSKILFDLKRPSIATLFGINLHSFIDLKIIQPTTLIEYFPNGSLESIFTIIKSKKSDKKWTPTKKIICLLGISHGMKVAHSKKLVHLIK